MAELHLNTDAFLAIHALSRDHVFGHQGIFLAPRNKDAGVPARIEESHGTRTQIKLVAACKSRCCCNNDPIHAVKSQHRPCGGSFPELTPTCAPRWQPWLLLSYPFRLLQRHLAHHRGPHGHLGRRGHHPCRRRGRQSLRPHTINHACRWHILLKMKWECQAPQVCTLLQSSLHLCKQGACRRAVGAQAGVQQPQLEDAVPQKRILT